MDELRALWYILYRTEYDMENGFIPQHRIEQVKLARETIQDLENVWRKKQGHPESTTIREIKETLQLDLLSKK